MATCEGKRVRDARVSTRDRLAAAEIERDKLATALRKADEDIKWMLFNRQFLSGEVFSYLDEALTRLDNEDRP